MHVCVRFTSFIISLERGRTRALSSACKINQADFIDYMSFLPSNLMQEINPNTEALSTNI